MGVFIIYQITLCDTKCRQVYKLPSFFRLMKTFEVRGKKIELPCFLPDATYGFVRGVNIKDVDGSGIKGLVVNIYHLLQKGFIPEIYRKRGIHKFIKFNGLIVSDSGGFQFMSLIRENFEIGKIKN